MMEHTNSYIFLNTKGSNNNRVNLKSFSDELSSELGFVTTGKKSKSLVISENYSFEDACNNIIAKLEIKQVKNIKYVYVSVEGKSDEDIVSYLESVDSIIYNFDFDNEYTSIRSYDYISEYYCGKLYPMFNTLERNLRNLLLKIYTLYLGSEYYSKTLDKELQDTIKQKLNIKGSTRNKKRLQEFFYCLDYGQIIDILFTPKWTCFEDEELKKMLSRDLSNLDDAVIKELISKLKPTSDWDRFFPDLIEDKDEFYNLLNEIRKYRNIVAHCKIIDKDDYQNCKKKIDEFNEIIKKAIINAENDTFCEEHLKYMFGNFYYIMKVISKMPLKSLNQYSEFDLNSLISKQTKVIDIVDMLNLPRFDTNGDEELDKSVEDEDNG